MNRLLLASAMSLLCVAGFAQKYKDRSLPVEQRVGDLLGRMTLDEKLGQLWQPLYDRKAEGQDRVVAAGQAGSFTIARADICTLEDRNRLQKIAVEQSRLGVPLIFGFDVIHGYKTLYPISLGMAASWDVDLAREAASMAAREAWVSGVDMTFSPMVDVGRDPRWGRVAEGYGEDPLLNAAFGRACVEGYQGGDPSQPYKIGACVKHFVGYGMAEGGRDYQFTEISGRTLREVYLPPFKACVDAGAVCVMSAFNDISGLPATGNYRAIRDILKNEWGFGGFVLSDWEAVVELKEHGIAADDTQAAVRALSAGVDMEMKSDTYLKTLKEALARKKITQQMIDDAARRVLRVKFELGLFDNTLRDPSQVEANVMTAENRQLARKAAAESFVLLKNAGNILPFDGRTKTLLVMGPWANSRDLYGWWIANGDNRDAVNVWEGISAAAPRSTTIVEGTNSRHSQPAMAVICVGEAGFMFGEKNNRYQIGLPFGQAQMVRDMKRMGYRTVVVVFNGRALDLSDLEPWADAILVAWHPGTEAGNAVADVLFGAVDPGGKLPVTFPKASGQIPIYYSMRGSGRPDQSGYVDLDDRPLYPFGFGLSYTTFALSGFSLSRGSVGAGESFTAAVTVTNTGGRKGSEVVQLYVHPVAGSFTQPRMRLIAFKRVELEAGASVAVTFDLKAEDLATLAADDRTWRIEPGVVEIMVGNSSDKVEKLQLALIDKKVK